MNSAISGLSVCNHLAWLLPYVLWGGMPAPTQHRQWTLRMFLWLFLGRVVHKRQRRGLCTKGADDSDAASASGAASLQSEGIHSEKGTQCVCDHIWEPGGDINLFRPFPVAPFLPSL